MVAQGQAQYVETLTERNAADAVSFDRLPVAQMSRAITRLSPGQQIAYTKDRAAQYPGYIAQALSDPEANIEVNGQAYKAAEISKDPGLYSQFLTETRYRFLDENGLSGLSMEAMREALDPMMQVEGQLLATNQDEFVAQQRTNAIQEALLLGERMATGEIQAGTADTIYSQLVYGYSGEYAKVNEEVERIVQNLPPERRQQFLDLELDNGSTFGELKSRWDRIRQNDIAEEVKDVRNGQALAQARVTQWGIDNYDNIRQQLEEAEGDSTKIQQIENSLEQALIEQSGGYNVDLPGIKNLVNSYSSKAADQFTAQFATDQQQGTLSLEKADQAPTVEAREAYIKAYRAQEVAKFGPEFAEAQNELETLGGRITQIKGQQAQPGEQNPFQGVVTRDLKALFRQRFDYAIQEYGVTTAEATAYALQGGVDVKAPQPGSILYEVDQGINQNNPDSRYYRSADSSYVTFPNLNLRGSSYKSYPDLKKAVDTPGFEDRANSVLSQPQLKNLSESWNNRDGTFMLPTNLTKALDDAGYDQSPKARIDLINRQIRAFNEDNPDYAIKELKPDKFVQDLDAVDPATMRIFEDMPDLSTVRAGRGTAQMEASQGDTTRLQRSIRMPGAQDPVGPAGYNPASFPDPSDVTDLNYPATGRTVQVGRALEKMGWRPWQHPDFNVNRGYTGSGNERVMRRDYNSSHHHGEALDYPVSNHTPAELDELYNYLDQNRQRFGIKTILWRVENHYDHLHVDFDHRIGG